MGVNEMTWMRLCFLSTVSFGLMLPPFSTSYAAKGEMGVGLSVPFYTGKESAQLTPTYGAQLKFQVTPNPGKTLSIVHQFSLGVYLGQNFGGSGGSYYGVSGEYQPGLKVNLAKQGLTPYLYFGPGFALFALMASSSGSGNSMNQGAAKYGYWVGTGFDWLKDNGKRGTVGGWGVGLHYFSYLKSPSSFEFTSAKLSVQGIKLDINFLFSSS